MNRLQRFESKLESMVSGMFARTFRSPVEPVEISAALNREAANSAQILSRDRRLVPNDYHVELSRTDHDRLSSMGPTLRQELVDMLREYADSQSYVFTGPVHITLELSDDLTTGRFRVRSRSVSDVRSADEVTDTGIRRATALLLVNGEQLPVSPPGLVIGRGNDTDLRIDDPGVSRRHVELRVVAGEYGDRVSIHDLGSTNGMLVDGRKTDQADLHDGSTVRIGNTTMELRLTARPHGSPENHRGSRGGRGSRPGPPQEVRASEPGQAPGQRTAYRPQRSPLDEPTRRGDDGR